MEPITFDDYHFAGVDELGAWLRAGRCTAAELADFALDALHKLAAPLNAVATFAPERAQAEASAADATLRAGIVRGALHGIPYGAKDLLATGGGLPTTWGCAPLRNQQFAEDATVIRLLQASGATLAAKLAMVELAGGGGYRQPNAAWTGPGRNPWNPEHWTGGSSSGSGAAVACGALPLAIGSETWGSILLPASFCGIVGVRPTYGLVSRHGAMALSWSMDKIGPLARSVADCARVLEVIGLPDAADPASSGRRFQYRPERFANWRPRFGLLDAEVADADPDIARAIEQIVPHLEQIGTVEKISLPDLPYSEVARLIISSEAASAFEDLIDSGQLGALTAPEDRVGLYAYEMIAAKDYIRALRVRSRIAQQLSALFDSVDILVAPTALVTANRLDEPFANPLRPSGRSHLSAASNLAGIPALSLPIGLDARQLPMGLQLVAGAFEDERLLAIGARLEHAIGWNKRPTLEVSHA